MQPFFHNLSGYMLPNKRLTVNMFSFDYAGVCCYI